ncbi:hypothetical protein G6F56_002396 [Rhizopus delemar]|uniref:F-box domain-containing protein n=1 Tax=Rhizopus stolonifer TaxID=4846 RepID=A0A367KMT2_RHIST|nr:hypothetical protein G6F56_002396 [Rhizopus delemar]RCI03545.1 hypothetical protein CU098_007062 [Rhizopus stolonifer]
MSTRSLPNELLTQIIHFTQQTDLTPYLFINKYTFGLVRQKVYRKVIFPDTDITEQDIQTFCQLYGQSICSIKLPQGKNYSNKLYRTLFSLCPRLNFLHASILFPSQLNILIPYYSSNISFMMTHIPIEEEDSVYLDTTRTVHYFPCCTSCFIFPKDVDLDPPTLTQISHYFHHPGALSNAILPTFGPDLLSLILNPFDQLTASVARLIVTNCPQLRYLVVPFVKAEGLWMLLRWCDTLTTIIVGKDGSPVFIDDEEEEEDYENTIEDGMLINQKAVESIKNHKRVWCVHTCVYSSFQQKRASWHIGIVPKA